MKKIQLKSIWVNGISIKRKIDHSTKVNRLFKSRGFIPIPLDENNIVYHHPDYSDESIWTMFIFYSDGTLINQKTKVK